jgi:hypothetical protein
MQFGLEALLESVCRSTFRRSHLGHCPSREGFAIPVQLQPWREARRRGARRAGWKIAAADRQRFSRSLRFAYLTSDTIIGSGGTYDAGADVALQAEATVALQIGARGRIVGFAAALELVDVVDVSRTGPELLSADVGHRAVSFGPTRPRLSAVDGRLLINGHLRAGAFLEGGYVDLLTQLSDGLSAQGESLLRGDWVITGPIARAPVWPGDQVVADLGSLGRAAIDIA